MKVSTTQINRSTAIIIITNIRIIIDVYVCTSTNVTARSSSIVASAEKLNAFSSVQPQFSLIENLYKSDGMSLSRIRPLVKYTLHPETKDPGAHLAPPGCSGSSVHESVSGLYSQNSP